MTTIIGIAGITGRMGQLLAEEGARMGMTLLRVDPGIDTGPIFLGDGEAASWLLYS